MFGVPTTGNPKPVLCTLKAALLVWDGGFHKAVGRLPSLGFSQ